MGKVRMCARYLRPQRLLLPRVFEVLRDHSVFEPTDPTQRRRHACVALRRSRLKGREAWRCAERGEGKGEGRDEGRYTPTYPTQRGRHARVALRRPRLCGIIVE